MTEKKAEELRSEELVDVWNAPDEAGAIAVAEFLRTQGIEATAVAVQIPWFGGVQTLHHGYWGKVEVMAHDAERARELIADFLQGTPEPEPPPGDAGEPAP